MKIDFRLTAACALATVGHVVAQPRPVSNAPPFGYADLVRESERHTPLEGIEGVTVGRLVFHKVRLDLKPVPEESGHFRVKKKDRIGFLCADAEPGFRGGDVVAVVTKHAAGPEGGHIYTLDHCVAKK